MAERSAGLVVWRRSPLARVAPAQSAGGASEASPQLPAGGTRDTGTVSPLEVWIAHMGGPFWARKEARAWTIPKGLYSPDEEPLAAALREFGEETGLPAPRPAGGEAYEELGEFRQRSGKIVTAFAVEAPDFDPPAVTSNTFPLEWPPRSGRTIEVPEVDRAEWTPLPLARERLVAGQVPVLDALLALHP